MQNIFYNLTKEGCIIEQYVKYLRKSRFDRDYADLSLEETLKRHEVILDKLAKDRGYFIGKTYYEVVSGESIAARPEVQKLLEEVGQGIWAGVLVIDVDRLARGNSIDQGIISQTFQYSGTKIITPSKTYDPSNEYDEEYFEFGLFMSRREYKTINRRLIRGRESSASEGKYLGSIPPYGYKKAKLENQKGFTLAHDPNEAPWVKKIFEMACEGNGTKIIANYLNDMKVPTRHGDLWNTASIMNIIENPTYIGKIRRGFVQSTKTIKDGIVQKKTKHVKDMSKYRIYDGLHPAIVSEEDFYKALEAKSSRNLNPKVRKEFELKDSFSGLIFCSLCGKRIGRTVMSKKRDGQIRVKCSNQRNCHNSGCSYDILEAKVLESLRIWLDGYIVRLNTVGYTKEVDECKLQIEQVDKELSKLTAQLEKAFELVEQGIYSLETFQERRGKLQADIDMLSAKKEEASRKIDLLMSDAETQINLIPKTKKLLEDYENLTVVERNNLLKEILVKIEYKKEGKGDIELDIYPRFSKFKI